ncbi:hypothetical protein BUALT_Bualt15G0034600 [Buddleja alternifolia]|uniref:Carboxypeptidase n=1 Tax=Buddleja alternifolia TaxID=168488 RepID=A0AAV6WIT0_9LAMI|nr:hypothetical protein BUALT_Bualt15G0034600 [Buddleja alternifolia]
MKASFLFISLLCFFAAYVECYRGRGYDPLGKLLRTRKSRKSDNHLTEDVLTEYSPVYIASQDGLKEADQITMLPGQPNVNFDQYSGYVTVDPTAGRALFYYFTEAEDSSSKPLVLWLNGGPGCSSIGSGAMTELGPFRVNPDGKTLWYNEYAWNKVANVLFLESPAGVGFSYSNTTSDYITGDKRTATDSYTFLVNWLERFPEYKTRDFYLTGESYAGHYVPQLADLILQNNKITNQTVINLKGIAIGNAYIDYTDRWTGTYDHFWTSALISDETHLGILQNCNFSSEATDTDICEEYQDKAYEEQGDVFTYDIYAPLCGSNSTAPSLSSFDPCSDDYVFAYLNTPEVQKALHANITGVAGPWEDCNGEVHANWQDEPDTVLPVIKKLMASGISVWIYSGDTDNIIPVTTTRYSMAKLGAPVKTPWYPWYSQEEVGGYVVGYENVTFVTIRGAGHFVPSYQPELASIQCYRGAGGQARDPLGEFIKAQKMKRSVNSYHIQDYASADYTPVYIAPQEGSKKLDEIIGLPGQPQVSFSQYSGYVTVDPKAGRALFYWFTEAEDSSNKPLVLWLNGGKSWPGCSSIGSGAMTELGPFRVNPDGKTLWHNKNAWNTVANVLFLESPAGVGFSYSNTTSDYVTGDKRTAEDSYTFLLNWFERFPEYKTRDFYITGESYAGHYVPQLASLILKNNKITNQTVINLKGVAIGNAYIDYEDEMTGMIDFFWTHALMSDEVHEAIFKNCNFSTMAPISGKCEESLDDADSDMGDVFYYDIYAPLCGSNSTAPSLSQFDPCSDDYVFTYLNTPEVQKALHANVTGTPGPWDSCNYFIFNNWNDQPETVLPVIKELMASGISVWIYSGDTDGRVPVTTTKYSMNKLGAPVKTPWYPWYNQGEVGGYVVEYQNVTFVTIRGAGHFVPSYQPERALTFFSSFLEGKLPPRES